MNSIDRMAEDVALAAEILDSIKHAVPGAVNTASVASVPESELAFRPKKKKKKLRSPAPDTANVATEAEPASTPTLKPASTEPSVAPVHVPAAVAAPSALQPKRPIDTASHVDTASHIESEFDSDEEDTSGSTIERWSSDSVAMEDGAFEAEPYDVGAIEHDSFEDGAVEDGPAEDDSIENDAIENDGRVRFRDLKLPAAICSALEASGYEFPTDIQAATIPALLEGRDVLGQAQTGTGKTAAFALPLLSRIDVEVPETQVLVLTPTRELAIQVSESFLRYGQHMRGLRVAPIYGGSAYATQINALRRGAHVVVGTPGRVMDHMRENRLRVDTLQALVLDEADEMLRMGFVDDVQWILEQTPPQLQIALFSATMPDPIRQIANRHLKKPHVIQIESKQRTADNIEQRFVIVDPRGKLEALERILEAEDFDGLIIFVKTKIATVEVAEHLNARGYSAVALNGDIAQNQRERTIEQLKDGAFNILVATDVAARGLDVQRITHVINYDLPFDSEAYVHRIGRTGRAGRSGSAIVFISPKQRGFLREIDRAAGQTIEPMAVPTAKEINSMRVTRFKEKIQNACSESARQGEVHALFEKLIGQCIAEHGLDPVQIAAGLATMAQGNRPFFVNESVERFGRRDSQSFERSRGASYERNNEDGRGRSRYEGGDNRERRSRGAPNDFDLGGMSGEKETFRVEVGRIHGVKPGNLVGAVANEIGLDSNQIGQIRIQHDYSTIDLPKGMPREVFKVLGRAWVVGRQLRISKLMDHPSERRTFKPKKKYS